MQMSKPKKQGLSVLGKMVYERTVGILRHELLNHIIPVNERHLEHLLKEYIGKYYNTAEHIKALIVNTDLKENLIKQQLPKRF